MSASRTNSEGDATAPSNSSSTTPSFKSSPSPPPLSSPTPPPMCAPAPPPYNAQTHTATSSQGSAVTQWRQLSQYSNGAHASGSAANNFNGYLLRPGVSGVAVSTQHSAYQNLSRPEYCAPQNIQQIPVPANNGNHAMVRSPWVAQRPAIPPERKPKRERTAFTPPQMKELEKQFAADRYLGRARRMKLSQILSLPERTLKIWFQNRRMKEKKDRLEYQADSGTFSQPDSGGNILNGSSEPTNSQMNSQDRYVANGVAIDERERYQPPHPMAHVSMRDVNPRFNGYVTNPVPAESARVNGYVTLPTLPESARGNGYVTQPTLPESTRVNGYATQMALAEIARANGIVMEQNTAESPNVNGYNMTQQDPEMNSKFNGYLLHQGSASSSGVIGFMMQQGYSGSAGPNGYGIQGYAGSSSANGYGIQGQAGSSGGNGYVIQQDPMGSSRINGYNMQHSSAGTSNFNGYMIDDPEILKDDDCMILENPEEAPRVNGYLQLQRNPAGSPRVNGYMIQQVQETPPAYNVLEPIIHEEEAEDSEMPSFPDSSNGDYSWIRPIPD